MSAKDTKDSKGGKDSRRRIQIDLPLVKVIRLFLWGKVRGLTKTEMAERIVIDRVSNPDNWNEVIRDLRQEAAIAQMPLNDYVASVVSEEFGLPREIDWSPLLETYADEEPPVEEPSE